MLSRMVKCPSDAVKVLLFAPQAAAAKRHQQGRGTLHFSLRLDTAGLDLKAPNVPLEGRGALCHVPLKAVVRLVVGNASLLPTLDLWDTDHARIFRLTSGGKGKRPDGLEHASCAGQISCAPHDGLQINSFPNPSGVERASILDAQIALPAAHARMDCRVGRKEQDGGEGRIGSRDEGAGNGHEITAQGAAVGAFGAEPNR
jgi:hypothetical protein